MHKANHPQTKHYNENIFEVNPCEACEGQPVGWAHFSPDCTHFSVAKGGKPVKKSIRGLAWVIVKWAGTVKPRIISMENVKEFMTWCPLVAKRSKLGRVIKADGTEAERGEYVPLSQQYLIPNKHRKGETFRKFIKAMNELGYKHDLRILTASDYGAPTSRKRLFIIFRRDGKPIVFPEPSHGDPKSEAVKSGRLLPWHTAAECINWSNIPKSIFEREKPLVDATLARIARGIKKFVADNPEPFILNYKFDNGPESSNNPLSTVTAVNNHYVVAPVITSIGQSSAVERSRGINEPLRTVVNKNEHCLVTPYLVSYHAETSKDEVRGQSVSEPIQTVDTSNRYGLAIPFIEKCYGGGYEGAGTSANTPLDTVTLKDHNRIVTAFISKYYNGDNQCSAADVPLHTITAKDRCAVVGAFISRQFNTSIGHRVNEPLGTVTGIDKSRLIEVYLEKHGINPDIEVHGEKYRIADICMRMLEPRELYNAQGFPDDYIIETDCYGNKYPKSKQVARCGNSVPPPFATAIVRANMPEWCVGIIDINK